MSPELIGCIKHIASVSHCKDIHSFANVAKHSTQKKMCKFCIECFVFVYVLGELEIDISSRIMFLSAEIKWDWRYAEEKISRASGIRIDFVSRMPNTRL